MDSHSYSHETSIFTLGAPHEKVQGRQTKLHPGFTMGKLVQPSPGIGLYEYRKQPITTKLPKTTENNLKIPKTT